MAAESGGFSVFGRLPNERSLFMLEGLTVGGYLPSSFLDWDGHVCAVIFTAGCNFRCPWCHNRELALSSSEPLSASAVVADIARRAKFLDGVVVSGGEPTIWSGLFPLLSELKALGISVKLDTNGSCPEVLSEVLSEGLAAHVAMDVKARFDAEVLMRCTGAAVNPEVLRRSVALIREKAPSYEFRTTYVPNLVSKADMLALRRELSDDEHWIVQCFKPVNCIDPSYMDFPAVSADEVRAFLPSVRVRG